MIHDLSLTLESILNDPALAMEFPELAAANVVFDRPDSSFTPQAPGAINLFLFEVRENLELRNNQPVVRRQDTLATVSKPPRRIDCSYLVTAWPLGAAPPPLPVQEHQLLSQALQVFGRFPTIPEPYLVGSLVPLGPEPHEPLPPMLAPHVDGMKSSAEFWTAMGNQVRASFTLTATLSVPVLSDPTGPMVTTTVAGFDPGSGSVDERLFGIGGRVRSVPAAGGQPIANALVEILDAGKSTRTDSFGFFTFPRVPRGARQFRVVAVGFQPLTTTVSIPGVSSDYVFELAL